MPSNIYVIDVSLNPKRKVTFSGTDNVNEIARDDDEQLIVWRLTGDAASGSFVAGSFDWIGEKRPPQGSFGRARFGSNGKTMWMFLTNNDDSDSDSKTTGPWSYGLSIVVDGKVYSSNTGPAHGDDPVIKNN